jgi:hypothetical protein
MSRKQLLIYTALVNFGIAVKLLIFWGIIPAAPFIIVSGATVAAVGTGVGIYRLRRRAEHGH